MREAVALVPADGALFRGIVLDTNLPYLAAAFAPILGMAVSFAIPLRMGEFNLGGNGQLVLGGLAAIVVGTTVPGPLAHRSTAEPDP